MEKNAKTLKKPCLSHSAKENKIWFVNSSPAWLLHGWNFKQLVFQTNKQFYQFYLCQSKACKFKHRYKMQHKENCSATLHTRQKLETKAGQKLHLSWRSASENYGCWQISMISTCNLDRKFKTHTGKRILTKNLWRAQLQVVATHLLYSERDSR